MPPPARVTTPDAPRRARGSPLVTLLAVLAVVAATLVAWQAGWFDYARLTRIALLLRSQQAAWTTALLFVAAWGVGTSLGFPALPLIVVGGALFGTWLGTGLSLVGTALGALGGYWLARVAAPPRLKHWVSGRLRMEELTSGSELATVTRLRLLPVVPLFVVTFGAGIARAPVWPYLAGTLLGQLPSTFLYSLFADRLLQSVSRGKGALAREVAIMSVLFFALSFVPRLFRRGAPEAPPA